jgi:hypothetical protein
MGKSKFHVFAKNLKCNYVYEKQLQEMNSTSELYDKFVEPFLGWKFSIEFEEDIMLLLWDFSLLI